MPSARDPAPRPPRRRRRLPIATPASQGRGRHCTTCTCPVDTDPAARPTAPTPPPDARTVASAALLLALGAGFVDLLRMPTAAAALRRLRHLHGTVRKDPLLVEAFTLATKRGRMPIDDTEALVVLYLHRHLRLTAKEICRALVGHIGDQDGWVKYRCVRAREALRTSGLREADLFCCFDWLCAAAASGTLPLPPATPQNP